MIQKTIKPIPGGSEQGGNRSYVPSRQFSARDLPGQTSMKSRPQGAVQGKDFRAELLERESKLQPNKDSSIKRAALVDIDDDATSKSIIENNN